MRPLLLTRPEAQAIDTAAQVEERCPGVFRPIISPLIRIVPENAAIDLDGVQALLFSSRNGVLEFARRWSERHIPALCVGDGTAQVATSVGLSAQSADGDSAALAQLAAQSYLEGGGHFLHLHGRETAGDIVGALAAEGIPVDDAILYDQATVPLSDDARLALGGDQGVLAPIYSPQTGEALLENLDQLGDAYFQRLTVLAISANAAAPFQGTSVEALYLAAAPRGAAMIEAIAAL